MILLIDIGNSRIKLGWLDCASGAREPEPLAVAHDDWGAIHAWLQGLPRTPVAALGSNVADAQCAHRVQAALALPVQWVNSCASAGGVRNGYATPTQLGADRWLALIGLTDHMHHLAERPLLLASYGTATTIDTLSPQDDDAMRTFVGGVILPGVRLMRSALADHTARLPLAQGAAAVFPTNTNQAIMSGVSAAQAGAVVQQWRYTTAHFGCAPVLCVSGGDWPWVDRVVQAAVQQLQADLGLQAESAQLRSAPVLDGLARLAKDQSRYRLHPLAFNGG